MHDNLDEILSIHERQLMWGFRALAITGFFALVLSLSRALDVGWQKVMTLHIALYLLVLVTVVLYRHLSFHVRAWILIGILFILGIAGLISWGLTAFGIPVLFMGCVICTIAFGVRAGIVASIISIISVGVIGTGFYQGYLSLNFDPNVYLNSLSAWAMAFITVIMCTVLIVVVLGTMNNQLFALINKLEQRNRELLGINSKLEEEFQERERLSREKLELQHKLQRAQKMEVVANVAGGVAHDLNNVLAGAVSYPDLMALQLPADSPLKTTLEKMKKSGLKAAAIVSDLLTLVRRGIVTKETTNLNLLIMEYMNSPEFEKLKSYHPGVEVRTYLDEALYNFNGSPFHIVKAIMNLVSNGAEAIPEKGKLAIKTQNCNVEKPFMGYDDEIKPGEYVVLEIEDTGSGMSREELEKVFEPFYSKKVMGKSGTGLGMTVVWGSVKDNNGHIVVQSAQGQGTSFKVYFPASHQKIEAADNDLPLESYKGNGESILVIDDVSEQREVAVELLSTLGYEAKAMPDGESAIRYLQENSVDLIVLDMIMDPGMDGLDTYKEIAKLYPNQKAIIATGYCETDRVREAQQLSSGSLLVKPFTLEKLAKKVKSELRNQKAA